MGINNSKLLSGAAPLVAYDQLTANRYEFLTLDQAEPSLGAGATNSVLTLGTSNARVWSSSVTLTSITSTGNVTAGNVFFGSGVVSGTGNIYANKIFANIQGNIDAAGNLYEIQFNTTGDQLGADANFTYDFVNNTLTVNGGNIVGGNVYVSGEVSAVGNITAPTFFGNLVGNITGNIDAGGANTQIQFNDDDILAGSAAFTFDKSSNLVTITGNVDAGNVVSQGTITANAGVYGDIYTTSIDSADSSAIIVTPDMILLSGLNVNQDITVGNIVIPSYGNITVGNVRIANLAEPVFNQDATTKRYVDSAIGNVLPIITNQTISPDGSSLIYTLDQATTAVGILVTINGISQTPNDSYTVVADQITFAEALLTTDVVQVRFLSGATNAGIIYTVDSLPVASSAGPGARAFVNDSNTTVFYSNVGNSGSNFVPVFSDGTTWRVG